LFTPRAVVQHAFYRKLLILLFGIWLAQLASTFGVVFGTVRAPVALGAACAMHWVVVPHAHAPLRRASLLLLRACRSTWPRSRT
jgi:hypothetical protein